jgi:hypothetical protein
MRQYSPDAGSCIKNVSLSISTVKGGTRPAFSRAPAVSRALSSTLLPEWVVAARSVAISRTSILPIILKMVWVSTALPAWWGTNTTDDMGEGCSVWRVWRV